MFIFVGHPPVSKRYPCGIEPDMLSIIALHTTGEMGRANSAPFGRLSYGSVGVLPDERYLYVWEEAK
jgi:hypothetical protein